VITVEIDSSDLRFGDTIHVVLKDEDNISGDFRVDMRHNHYDGETNPRVSYMYASELNIDGEDHHVSTRHGYFGQPEQVVHDFWGESISVTGGKKAAHTALMNKRKQRVQNLVPKILEAAYSVSVRISCCVDADEESKMVETEDGFNFLGLEVSSPWVSEDDTDTMTFTINGESLTMNLVQARILVNRIRQAIERD
jgi:hypothetical protein